MFSYLIGLIQSVAARLAVRDEDGQALVEYGILVGLIAVVCITVIGLLGGQISSFFQSIVNAL